MFQKLSKLGIMLKNQVSTGRSICWIESKALGFKTLAFTSDDAKAEIFEKAAKLNNNSHEITDDDNDTIYLIRIPLKRKIELKVQYGNVPVFLPKSSVANNARRN